MINKQGLWFLTLFSLILVLGIYYVTMPNELFTTNNGSVENKETNIVSAELNESNYITALKIELDEQREKTVDSLEKVLNDSAASSQEKNSAYEAIKEITSIKGIEENLVTKIKNNYSLDSFIKVNNDEIDVVIEKENHDVATANKIMRLIQEEFSSPMNISIKFS